MEIRIYKAKRILEAWQDGVQVAAFPCGIGREERGHKIRRGDGRTPEGTYRICVKNPRSRFFLSLGLNYPNPADAARALAAGVIARDDHDRILLAHEEGKGPPWDTELGGEIYIHGELEKQAWSEGCVRLRNADMETLYGWVENGVPVRIEE